MTEECRNSELRLQMMQEMRAQNFDMIRFASYRTACKLRFVQKKVNLHALDIWNVIEAFRENGLNTLEPQAEVGVSRLETLVSSLYHSLNKRLPPAQLVRVEACSGLLLNWLLSAYCVENLGKIRVFSIKVALATMCAGKLMDKLRYIFSQISDPNGHLVTWRFAEYLQEVLALPAAVYESPSFNYVEGLAGSVFPGTGKVTVNDFMDTMMSDPGPHCMVWLPLLHRLASVETVVHPTACDACQREGFSGFRYRCQKCHSYQLCQDCFWRGRVSGPHTNDHEVKEYTTYKSPSKQIGHSLRKSFRCVPEKGRTNIPRFPEEPEKTLNLSHIVPPSPLPSHNGFPDGSFVSQFDGGSMDSRSTGRSGGVSSGSAGKHTASLESTRLDDEHRLIARYAARLAAEARGAPVPQALRTFPPAHVGRAPSEGSLSLDTSRAQRELISQLEAKNREIMREIARLRRQQELEAAGAGGGGGEENPALMAELRALRQRKDELESHLGALQDSRRQLMVQLEGLMKLLKNHQASPRSTPNSSPRSTKSPPLPPSSRSAPPTPGAGVSALGAGGDVLVGVGGDVRSAFGSSSAAGSSTTSLAGSPGNSATNSSGRSLRNDLLVAADSVTNAMSTLVRELNSEGSDQEDAEESIRKPLDFETEAEADDASATAALWREEIRKRYEQESQFIAELRARSIGNGQEYDDKGESSKVREETTLYEQAMRRHASGLTDEDGFKEENYVDKDEVSETDWEEAMKRWVNR
ncbi:dystrobrevin beta-like [Bacillus rossius redtenbacheri]|uniref:dystrobrevin beta-like n=1 Tax=Bacillus rossius redtenbacheri TaxID=93214 RepID=UPI002FDDF1FE